MFQWHNILYVVASSQALPGSSISISPHATSLGGDVNMKCQFSALTGGQMLRIERFNEKRESWIHLAQQGDPILILPRYTYNITKIDVDNNNETIDYLMTFNIKGK